MKSLSLILATFLFPVLAFAGVKSDKLQALPKNDQLQAITDNIHTIWNDNNVTSGTSVVSVAVLKNEAPKSRDAWKDLAKEIYADAFKAYENQKLPSKARLTVKSSAFDEDHVEDVVDALAEANDYSKENKDGENAFRRQTWQLVRTLGAEEKLQTFSVKSRIKDDTTGEIVNVRLNAFVNKENSKIILIFTVEGRI